MEFFSTNLLLILCCVDSVLCFLNKLVEMMLLLNEHVCTLHSRHSFTWYKLIMHTIRCLFILHPYIWIFWMDSFETWNELPTNNIFICWFVDLWSVLFFNSMLSERWTSCTFFYILYKCSALSIKTPHTGIVFIVAQHSVLKHSCNEF